MDTNELMKKINDRMEHLDLVSARKYMENNLEAVKKNRHLLKSNARSLFEILPKNTESAIHTLNRREMNVIYSINSYASNFDIRGLRLAIKNNMELLIRKDIVYYLNEDAKTLLHGMNVINYTSEQ